jgi:hypothetical protein
MKVLCSERTKDRGLSEGSKRPSAIRTKKRVVIHKVEETWLSEASNLGRMIYSSNASPVAIGGDWQPIACKRGTLENIS